MALQELTRQSRAYIGSNTGQATIDFLKKIKEFTDDLSSAQIKLLRNHLNELSLEQAVRQARKHSELSKRETEVLILLSNGYNRRDIGHSLGISANTAARHIANIYQKLGISCVAEATHYALSHHIIS